MQRRTCGAARRAAIATATLLAASGALSLATPAAADPPITPPGQGGTPPGQAADPPGQGEPPPDAGGGEEPPGNRGTVKIHDVATGDEDRRTEPHVCEFRIIGFGFPDDADLLVTIAGHGGPNAGTGSFTADLGAGAVDDAGDFAIDGPTLPDGMYRLEVENRTAPGGAKQKVFHVDCTEEAVVETTTTTSTTSATSTSTTTTTTTTTLLGGAVEEPTPPAGETLVAGAGATRAAAATQVLGAQVARGPRAVALTGVDAAAMAAAGLGLVVAGAALRRRTYATGGSQVS